MILARAVICPHYGSPPGTSARETEKKKMADRTFTYYLGEMSNGSHKLLETYPRGIGRCYIERPIDPFTDEPWFLDNGVFREWNRNGRNIDTDYSARYAYFESRIPRAAELVREGRGPDFIVAPDRPGDPTSLFTTVAWLDAHEADLEGLGLPVYMAVQDGMVASELAFDDVLERIDGIFLGGSDAFKTIENATEWRNLATDEGLAFHWGRCTQSRIADAIALGCDSADSAHPNRLAGARWDRFLEVFDAAQVAA